MTSVLLFRCFITFILIQYTVSLISSIESLDFEDDHLKSHVLLRTEHICDDVILNDVDHDIVIFEIISMDFMSTVFNVDHNGCTALYLERGMPLSEITHIIPERIYKANGREIADFSDWFRKRVLNVEIGFVSYMKNPAEIFWVSPTTGEKFKVADLGYAEINTAWVDTQLGHQFQVIDTVTNQVIGEYIAEYSGFYPLGDAGSFVGTLSDLNKVKSGIKNTLKYEFQRHNRIKRTFTELGFNKGKLPSDLWGSIQAYYYNNRNHSVREEYESKGNTVNWWEADSKLIGMPWKLKGYWQTRLRDLVQDWIGLNNTLENTDIYGMRRYEDGARLLSHVDREATHAASLIVNVAQSNIREPWTVEIYDHADRLHEIEMNPGDIVYYESARCLHGRMKPLRGDYYVNFFAHYRPIGDPEWFLKPNPEGTVSPLIDLNGDCYTNEDNTQTCDPPITLPTLSPTGHVVKGPDDLFEYWKLVSPQQPQDSRRRDEL